MTLICFVVWKQYEVCVYGIYKTKECENVKSHTKAHYRLPRQQNVSKHMNTPLHNCYYCDFSLSSKKTEEIFALLCRSECINIFRMVINLYKMRPN